MKRLFLFFLFIIRFSASASDEFSFPIGARAWGLGRAVVAMADSNQLPHNVAGLSFCKTILVSSSAHSLYGVSGLQTLALGVAIPQKAGTFGLTFRRFGDKLYNETTAGIAFAKNTNRVSLGIGADYYQVGFEQLGNKRAFRLHMGLMAVLSSKVRLGAFAQNVFGAKLPSIYENERLPMFLQIGICYKPEAKLQLFLQAEKDIEYKEQYSGGFEYEIIKGVSFRSGLILKPVLLHYGLGIGRKQWAFDYATHQHPQLGWSHHLSLLYRIPKTTLF